MGRARYFSIVDLKAHAGYARLRRWSLMRGDAGKAGGVALLAAGELPEEGEQRHLRPLRLGMFVRVEEPQCFSLAERFLFRRSCVLAGQAIGYTKRQRIS